MIFDDDAPSPCPPSERRTIAIAVMTAAATTLATALVTWAVEELKAKLSKPAAQVSSTDPKGATQK